MTPQATDHPSRLAAVWMAGLVGYRDLLARDEELAQRVLKELRGIARRQSHARGGRVASTLEDAVVSIFGGVEGAVRAAVALRDEFLAFAEARAGGVSLRVGVHVGEVFDAPDGEVYGEAVKVAARIERAAEPGQVVLSQVAYLPVQGRAVLEAEELGEVELKGVPGTVRLFGVRGLESAEVVGVRELLQEAIAPLQLLDVEGKGGMGEIYLARDPGLKRTLAVKVLRSELTADSRARARFQREATIIAGLTHPNVITIHSVGELADETPYFVMDYVEGGSLADRLEQEGPLSVHETRRILGEVASALQAAHAKGIVHRDIKAANVLWDLETGRVMVTDWGIAALDPGVEMAPDTRLTRTGVFIGSPKYMSPEQLAGDEVGPGTDTYNLGLLAFELLMGHGPFPGETPREVMIAQLREDPPSLSALRDDVDPDFDAVIARCLAKNPGERPTAESIARRFAPGTESLLEWPPPGLDTLPGQLNRSTLFLGIGALLLLQATILLFANAGSWDAFLAGTEGFKPGSSIPGAVLLALGTLSLAVGLWQLLRIGASTRRGVALGYGWMTILETLADYRKDGGLLIAGDREYAVLDEKRRTGLRRGRIVLSLATLAAALLPLLLLPVLLVISTWTGMGWFAVLTLSFMPTVLIVMAGGAWELWWALRLRGARRAFARRRRRLEPFSPLVRPWYQSFELARGGSHPGRGSQGRRWAGALLTAGMTGVVGVGVFLVGMHLFIATSFPQILDPRIPGYANIRERVGVVDRVRWLRLPVDSTGTPGEAGQLVQTILEMDTAASWATERVPESAIEGSRLLEPSMLLPPYRLNRDSLISLALRGLSPGEEAYLAGFVGDPRLPLFERLAELPEYDPGWSGVLDADQLPGSISFPLYRPLTAVGYSNLARAALAASQGDLQTAERFLRQNLSAGLLLSDNARFVLEALIGSVVGSLGARGLEELYLARGDRELTTRMQRSWGRLEAGSGENADLGVRMPAESGPSILDILRDSSEVRSIRLELLRGLPVIQSCATLEWLLWGPPPEFTLLLEEIRPQLVRYPAEEAYFRAITEEVERTRALSWSEFVEASGLDGEHGTFLAGLGKVASLLTGNPRLDACTRWVAINAQF